MAESPTIVARDGTRCVIDECAGEPIGSNVALCGQHAAQLVKAGIVHPMGLYLMRESGRDALATTHRPPAEVEVIPSHHGQNLGFVYVVRFSDRIKIGFSTDWKSRVKSLPVDEVLLVMTGSVVLERALHAKFAAHRVVGEWFNDCPEIRHFISDQKAGVPA